MAMIPLGEFGLARAVPRAQPSRVDLSVSQQEGQALENLGRTMMQVGEQGLAMQQRRQAEAQQEAEALARAKATNALLDDEIEQAAIVDDIRSRVADGTLPYAKAHEDLYTRLSVRSERHIDDLDPVGDENYRRGLTRNRFRATTNVDGIIETAKRADFKGQILGMRDKLGKVASNPNADIATIVERAAGLRELADAAGIGGDFDQEQQAFADRAYSDNARARLVAGRDSMEALGELERDLTEEGGYYVGKLDADKTNTILSQVQVRKAQIEARADTDARKGEAASARVLTRFEQQIASTVPAPVETMAEWAETVRLGTPEQQAEFEAMLGSEIQVREMLSKPPAEQRAALLAAKAEQRANGATLQEQANAKRLEAAIDANLKDLREQPLVAYGRITGAEVAPLNLQALSTGDLAAVQGQLASRADTLAAMRAQYGDEVGSAPLLPQEAMALSAALGQAGPQRAAEFFGILSTAIDDPGVYRAAMQQIAPDSPVRAFAGMIFAEQRQTTLRAGSIFRGAVKAAAGDVARTMLEGEALLNKSKGDKAEDGKGRFPVPPPSQFNQELAALSFDDGAGSVGEAFAGNPEAYEIAEQGIRAYYVGMSAKLGDVSGEVDRKRLSEAVRAVVGEPVDVNGGAVFAPWGMAEDDFMDHLESTWTAAVPKIPAGFSRDFDDYQLRQVGSNTYRVIGAGGAYLHGADGAPLTLVLSR